MPKLIFTHLPHHPPITSLRRVDANGNVIISKPVTVENSVSLLTIVTRSEKDLATCAHTAYKLLVP